MSQHSAAKPAEGKLRYDNLDGLRAYAAIGIVLMHVLSNGAYELDGFVFDRLIPSFTDLVFLFMVISGFSMCCGYYEKIVGGQINLGQFYAKRFAKVWPFFAVLCLVDFAMSPSMNALYEVLANLTLCFGLIPKSGITVIGVGWFLGLVFVFYFMFPFICGLLSHKKRAWLAFAVALLMSALCVLRFDLERGSFAYSGVFFLAGGMIYLYREPLRRLVDRFGWIVILLAAASLGLYYLHGSLMPVRLVTACAMMICALGKKNVLMYNPVTKLLSGISLEIYLCHMMVYRLLEKLKITHLFQSELLSYAVTAVVTVASAIVMSVAVNKVLSLVGGAYQKRKSGGNNNVR